MSLSAVSESRPPSTRIVTAVASKADVDPIDLPPLYDVIEPDALDRFVRCSNGDAASEVSVTFSYTDHTVSVYGDGDIDVEETSTNTVDDG